MKYLLIVMIMITNNSFAGGSEPVGSGFNYQGELRSAGATASGTYDFSFRLFNAQSGGIPVSNIEDHFDVQVTDGVFNIDNLDFGDIVYNGDQLWLEIRVKLASAVEFETLSPLQRITAVPYAVQAEFVNEDSIGTNEIIDGSIHSNDVADNSIVTSKLAEQSVGTDELKDEAITSSTIADDAINKFHISDDAVETHHIKNKSISVEKLSDSGVNIGEILQFDGNDWITTDLPSANSPWNSNGTNINYTAGQVSIGTTSSTAGLKVRVTNGSGYIIQAQSSGTTKFIVDDNGGTSIGALTTPPTNGLRVSGNIKQPINSNGMMKYMVHANCIGSNPTILKSYDGVTPDNVNNPITIQNSSPGCIIEFPDKIDQRYWQASLAGGSATLYGAKCYLNTNNDYQLICVAKDDIGFTGGSIMVLVY